MKNLVFPFIFSVLLLSCSENNQKQYEKAVITSQKPCKTTLCKSVTPENKIAPLPCLPKNHPPVKNTAACCQKRSAINAKICDAKKISEAEWLRLHFNEFEAANEKYEVAGTEFIPTEINGERCFVEKSTHADISYHAKNKKSKDTHLTEGVPLVVN